MTRRSPCYRTLNTGHDTTIAMLSHIEHRSWHDYLHVITHWTQVMTRLSPCHHILNTGHDTTFSMSSHIEHRSMTRLTPCHHILNTGHDTTISMSSHIEHRSMTRLSPCQRTFEIPGKKIFSDKFSWLDVEVVKPFTLISSQSGHQ